MGKYVISKRKNEEFQFELKAGNGEIILVSEGYTTKANCENGIESVRKNATDDSKYDRKMSTNEKHYFNLKAVNGQVIGTSQMYVSEATMNSGIDSVKHNAPGSPVEDTTEK